MSKIRVIVVTFFRTIDINIIVNNFNKPYFFIGRRQMREGELLTLFADSVVPITKDLNLTKNIVTHERSYYFALKEAGRKAESEEREISDVKQKEKPKTNNVLRIRFKGDPAGQGFDRLLNFLVYFHGTVPVEVEFASDSSIVRLDEVCNIDPDEEVLNALAKLVGEDSINFI